MGMRGLRGAGARRARAGAAARMSIPPWVLLAAVVAMACVPGAWGKYTLFSSTGPIDAKEFDADVRWVPDDDTTERPPEAAARLRVRVQHLTDSVLRVRVTDAQDDTRWEVPGVLQDDMVGAFPDEYGHDPGYVVRAQSDPFSLRIERTATGTVLWDSAAMPLVFNTRYLQWGTAMPADANLYGLGERIHPLRLDIDDDEACKTFTIFTKDNMTPYLKQDYGAHPFFLAAQPMYGTAHGVLLLNSNAMDVVRCRGNATHGEEPTLTFRTVGGIVDMMIFLGDRGFGTPMDVVREYHAYIGKPYLPPYWALGFHQCRWGYHTAAELAGVADGYAAANLPLEVMWSDIDYMDEFRVWTMDADNYAADMPGFLNTLHNNDQRYVMIVDPGVRVDPDYDVYSDGLAKGLFVLHPTDDRPYLGKVWPGPVHFPDWSHPATTQYWTDHALAFHQQFPYDGLWIDMNEVASFCRGSCEFDLNEPSHWVNYTSCPQEQMHCPYYEEDHPPYLPGGDPLDTKTMPMAARHHAGLEYDMHSLFGHMEGMATLEALHTISGAANERAFILSRSTFVGSGHYVNHWLGDNRATWEDMRRSIPGVLNFQLFGIPLVGADICGFLGDTTEKLCMAWTQLGAFYPFMRNHNHIDAIPQEYYRFSARMQDAVRDQLHMRYELLPYLYTHVFLAHANGGPLWRPLFMQFFNDERVSAEDEQFMVGDALLVVPYLYEQPGEQPQMARVYAAGGRWYDYFTGEVVALPGASGYIDKPVHLYEHSIVHVRGGAVVARQDAAPTTTAARRTPFNLLVALDENSEAAGELVVDDGATRGTVAAGAYTHVAIEASESATPVPNNDRLLDWCVHVETTVKKSGYAVGPMLDRVAIYGWRSDVQVQRVTQGGASVQFVERAGVVEVHGLGHDVRTALALSLCGDLVLPAPLPDDGDDDDGDESDDSSNETKRHSDTPLVATAVIVSIVALAFVVAALIRRRRRLQENESCEINAAFAELDALDEDFEDGELSDDVRMPGGSIQMHAVGDERDSGEWGSDGSEGRSAV